MEIKTTNPPLKRVLSSGFAIVSTARSVILHRRYAAVAGKVLPVLIIAAVHAQAPTRMAIQSGYTYSDSEHLNLWLFPSFL